MSTQRPYAEVLPDGQVAIHSVKVVYIYTPGEILFLAGSCRSLQIVAARRGKMHKRAEATAHREAMQGRIP